MNVPNIIPPLGPLDSKDKAHCRFLRAALGLGRGAASESELIRILELLTSVFEKEEGQKSEKTHGPERNLPDSVVMAAFNLVGQNKWTEEEAVRLAIEIERVVDEQY